MKTEDRRRLLAGGLTLAAIGSAPAASPQEPGQGIRLGVVSLKRCFGQEYKRMQEIDSEISQLRDFYAREAEDLRRKIATLTESLGEPKTPDARCVETFRIRGHAEYDLKLSQEVGRRRVQDLTLELEGRVFAEIRRVVALVAKGRKIELVLRADEPPAGNPEGATRAASLREMLFHERALDLTQTVLDQLNAEWLKAWACPKCKRKAAGDLCPCGSPKP